MYILVTTVSPFSYHIKDSCKEVGFLAFKVYQRALCIAPLHSTMTSYMEMYAMIASQIVDICKHLLHLAATSINIRCGI